MPLNMERLNILLVDDNASMRTLVKQILNAFGIKNIVECADGSDALQELRNFPADIVITDWMMEPVDGIDLARLTRTAADSPNPFIPIIMLTGHTERYRVEEARDAGVTEFLAKPISANSVYQRLQQIIEIPRPFIRTKKFVGPDRRRRHLEMPGGTPKRRSTDIQDEISVDPKSETGAGLDQDAVNKLLES